MRRANCWRPRLWAEARGSPRQGINRAKLFPFAQALQAMAGCEIGNITDSAYVDKGFKKVLRGEYPFNAPGYVEGGGEAH